MTVEHDPELADDETDEGTVPKSEAQRAYAARQKAKEEARQHKERADSLASKLAQYEAKEKQAEESRLREAEDWKELEKRLSKERDEALATLDGERKSIRRGALVDAVAQATGRQASREKLRIMMAGLEALGQYQDLEWAPERLEDKAIDKVAKVLMRVDPDFFKNEARGGTPGVIGTPTADDDEAAKKARVVAMAKKYSS